MTKELKTAEQLRDMITSTLNVRDVDIQIRRDHAYGWQPIVVSSPGDLIGYARSVRPQGMTAAAGNPAIVRDHLSPPIQMGFRDVMKHITS